MGKPGRPLDLDRFHAIAESVRRDREACREYSIECIEHSRAICIYNPEFPDWTAAYVDADYLEELINAGGQYLVGES